MKYFHFLTAAALIALSSAWVTAASAQVLVVPPEAQQPASSYSDDELKSFANAAVDVHRIRNAYLPHLEAAQSADEEHQVISEASTRMVQAVERQGITVDQYTEIAALAEQNPEVAAVIQQHVQEAISE